MPQATLRERLLEEERRRTGSPSAGGVDGLVGSLGALASRPFAAVQAMRAAPREAPGTRMMGEMLPGSKTELAGEAMGAFIPSANAEGFGRVSDTAMTLADEAIQYATKGAGIGRGLKAGRFAGKETASLEPRVIDEAMDALVNKMDSVLRGADETGMKITPQVLQSLRDTFEEAVKILDSLRGGS